MFRILLPVLLAALLASAEDTGAPAPPVAAIADAIGPETTTNAEPESAPAPATPPTVSGAPSSARTYSQRVITNYWHHINDILSTEAAKPPRDERRMTLRNPPPRTFPFDAFQHLECRDLLRATDEGIREARRGSTGRTPEAVDRQVMVNAATALEYYPLLATKDDDAKPLFTRMENVAVDPILRVYLIERCVMGLAPQSLIASYLQENAVRNRHDVRTFLIKLATDPMEVPVVQIAAMKAAYRFLCDEFTEPLAKEASVNEWAAFHNLPVSPAILKAPDPPAVSLDTQAVLDRAAGHMQSLAAGLAALLQPSANRPPQVHDTARALLAQINQEFPLPDPAAISAALEPAPDTAQ